MSETWCLTPSFVCLSFDSLITHFAPLLNQLNLQVETDEAARFISPPNSNSIAEAIREFDLLLEHEVR